MTEQKDKLNLGLADNDRLKELISRMEPGDKAVFTITATLDESANDIALFSVVKVKVPKTSEVDDETDEDPAEEAKESPTEEAAEETDEVKSEPVMQMMQNQGGAEEPDDRK